MKKNTNYAIIFLFLCFTFEECEMNFEYYHYYLPTAKTELFELEEMEPKSSVDLIFCLYAYEKAKN